MSHDTFISRLAKHIQNRYDLQKQEVTIIFPNKRAAFYLRNAFKDSCSQTIWLPQIISIEEAVTQWSGIALTDNIDLLFELIDIDAQLHKKKDSDISVFGSQAAQMAKDFDEIDQYGIDAKSLFSYVLENKKLGLWDFDTLKSKEKEQKYLQFFHALYDYYLGLHNRLAEQKRGYYGMITRYLSELPEAELIDKVGNQSIIFAGFNALTTTEERIVDTLVKNGKAEIHFDYDSYYVDDINNRAGLFARKYQQCHPQWLKNGISRSLTTEKKVIHLIKVGGKALQAKALQAKLQESDCHDAVVVLADEKLLIPILNAIPDTNTYKDLKVSMGYPINKTPLNHLVSYYFMLQRRKPISREINGSNGKYIAKGWYIWLVLRLMELEIINIVFPKQEIAAFNEWKNEVLKQGKFVFEDADIESFQAPHLQAFLRVILSEPSTSPLLTLQTLEHTLSILSNVVNGKEDKESYYFLLNQISEIGKTISRLSQIVKDNENYITETRNLEVLYRLLSSNATVKLNSSSIEGLQIMGMLETRNIDIKRLHVLSVNENILPPEKPRGSFIPQFIRHHYGMPGYEEAQAVTAYHFYRLLQNGEDINLYYNNLSDASEGEASRYILQIRYELSKHDNISIQEETFGCQTNITYKKMPLNANKANASERLHRLIESEKNGISPSSLSTYINCPLKYYLKYVAQIKDNSVKEEIGENIKGTIIHDTLKFLFAPYLPNNGAMPIIDKNCFDQIIEPKWKDCLAQSLAHNMPGGLSNVGFNYLKHINIKQQLKNYMKYTSKQLESNSLIILKTEETLKTSIPTELGTWVISGQADRIDKRGNVFRVIDYKTGKVESKDVKLPVKKIDETALDYLKRIPEKALQLLLYKYLFLKENQDITPDQVTAAIHGLMHTTNIEYSLTKTPPSKSATGIDAAFLDDSTFIDDMECMLKDVIAEILDPNKPFVQSESDQRCDFCEFNKICERGKKKK